MIAVKVPVFVVSPCVFFHLCVFFNCGCVPTSLTQPLEEEKRNPLGDLAIKKAAVKNEGGYG